MSNKKNGYRNSVRIMCMVLAALTLIGTVSVLIFALFM